MLFMRDEYRQLLVSSANVHSRGKGESSFVTTTSYRN